ncbi:MAG: helix-turn-helix domain-containing protein [Sphingomonas sp.]|uniref:helix-turn-helix domain-containing protein n=1 Tax=Sphingomonas sp. TaxID=28214 RepID=UPI003F8062B9
MGAFELRQPQTAASPGVVEARRDWPTALPLASNRGVERLSVFDGVSALLGSATADIAPERAAAQSLNFAMPGWNGIATVRFDQRARVLRDAGAPYLTLLLRRDVLPRLGAMHLADGISYHLPPRLRSILAAIHACSDAGVLRRLSLAAKCAELLCGVIGLGPDDLIATTDHCRLSSADTERIVHAKRIIAERPGDSLSLESIARQCGVNRVKLTNGFRMIYGCSVGDAIAEARFAAASELLLSSDKNIDEIAYRVGYRNTAAFTRAFGRHFGTSPARYRSAGGGASNQA